MWLGEKIKGDKIMEIPNGEYRAWVGEIDKKITPKTFKAIRPLLSLDSDEYYNSYSTYEIMTQVALGFNETTKDPDEIYFAVVFKKGEEPKEGQFVKLINLAELN